MSNEHRQLRVEHQTVGGLDILTREEQAALTTGDSSAEQIQTLREQRRQLFTTIDRMRGRAVDGPRVKRQSGQPHLTIKHESYMFKKPLGAGGHSVAIDAVQGSSGEPCVIKCTSDLDRTTLNRNTPDAFMMRKAVVEVAVLKKLAGVHAPRLLDAQLVPHPDNMDKRMMVVAMEKVVGESGADVAEHYDRAEQSHEIIKRVHALLRGIYEIHQVGVLHLDLKPDHIFFNDTGDDATFIDFGVGHMPEQALRQQAGMRDTSPHYAEPLSNKKYRTEEFAPPEDEVSPKYDAYSVGRIIQTFLHSDTMQPVPPALQPLQQLAERMTLEQSHDRLDIGGALQQFYAAYPSFQVGSVKKRMAG